MTFVSKPVKKKRIWFDTQSGNKRSRGAVAQGFDLHFQWESRR